MYICESSRSDGRVLIRSEDEHSSDPTRSRPSQPSTTNGPRPSISVNRDDSIIIVTHSEDGGLPAIRSTKGWTEGSELKGGATEVILILDSDEDLGTSGALRPPAVSAVQTSTSRPNPPPQPSQWSSAAPPPAPKPVTAPTPTTLVLTSTRLFGHPPSRPQDIQQQDNNPPSQPPSSPPYIRSRTNGYQLHWMVFKLFMTLDELLNLLVDRCWIQPHPNPNLHVLEDWRRHKQNFR
ncbi:hypothetical protein L210DRAFT_3645280 [Boletus edulis BED1]|uniref:Uncharacterized protein n=1 Tax=Boletus edulis BED1 TaxID=1328754 RepID=A0AAD4BWJ9_BOLED|nr:hypothetical protein L210DRAFT_3645280 [Boletus edulis BED1]